VLVFNVCVGPFFKELRVNKIYPNAAAALQGVVADGQLMAVGGFGLCGIPEARR